MLKPTLVSLLNITARWCKSSTRDTIYRVKSLAYLGVQEQFEQFCCFVRYFTNNRNWVRYSQNLKGAQPCPHV